MVRCKHCGNSVHIIQANCFLHDGSDSFFTFIVHEGGGEDAVFFDLPVEWCGTDLSDEEKMGCIRCPRCGKFPFSETSGINTEQTVRVVCFKEERPCG